MVKAIWNGQVIAESDDTVVVEGNHYFPAQSVNAVYLTDSAAHTTCHWKGTASYYSLSVDGQVNTDGAWYYPDPKPEAEHVRGRVAFWRGVQVVEG
jgi:uncharacterized protein (DUF427 family)